MKLFSLDDYVKDGDIITLFCSKQKDFEITFSTEKFEDWLQQTDRLMTEIAMFNSVDYETREVNISLDEYWGCSDSYIKNDLYEYVLLRLVAPHELFNGTEKALLNILNTVQ